ncbi:MAG: 1-acyl-sn-glycerol-3-phosphate acyltransferase [Pirellulaceae bacterium]
MQHVVIEKPYQFVPPHRGTWWPSLIRDFNLHAIHLRRVEGVVDYECRHLDRLRASMEAGHGILLAPNHSRNADPLVLGWLCRETPCLIYALASWHLFNQGWFHAWAIRKMGGFSVNRETIDRQAINTAIEILETAERPLVIFPEGAMTRTNDRLHALLDGVSFIARTAAKRRAKRSAGKVVVHPVGIKYLFGGDLRAAVEPVLSEIESRFTWQSDHSEPLIDRIGRIGQALLCLKEIEYFGRAQHGRLHDRIEGLIDRLLSPLEDEWLSGNHSGGVVARVKALRMKLLPGMIEGRIDEVERRRRWKQLGDIYLAQQVSCYPPDYLTDYRSVDRMLETVERFEEDLTDRVRVHGSLKAIIEIDEPIEVSPERDRKAKVDPLMAALEQRLTAMLARLAEESRPFEERIDVPSEVTQS